MPEGTTPDVLPSTAEGAGTQVTGAPTGAAPQADTTAGERKFTQAEVNAMVRKDVEGKLAKLKADADERAALEAGKFQELAEQRQARIAEIEPQLTTTQERLAAYEQLMTKEVAERSKALPEKIRAMMPKGDVLEQRQWLVLAEEAAAEAAKLQIQRNPGTPSGPRGTGAQSSPQPGNDEAARASQSTILRRF